MARSLPWRRPGSGLARALTAAVYVAKENIAELADTYTVHADLKLTFEKKDTKK